MCPHSGVQGQRATTELATATDYRVARAHWPEGEWRAGSCGGRPQRGADQQGSGQQVGQATAPGDPSAESPNLGALGLAAPPRCLCSRPWSLRTGPRHSGRALGAASAPSAWPPCAVRSGEGQHATPTKARPHEHSKPTSSAHPQCPQSRPPRRPVLLPGAAQSTGLFPGKSVTPSQNGPRDTARACELNLSCSLCPVFGTHSVSSTPFIWRPELLPQTQGPDLPLTQTDLTALPQCRYCSGVLVRLLWSLLGCVASGVSLVLLPESWLWPGAAKEGGRVR